MAGEMEEPVSFRADSIHSGSISFGRFETEPLSWERRSSFSHNRFLEEVGKYSIPGSVTQKKAYFEAHFKKKALLHQTSTEGLNGVKYETREKDMLDHMNSMEEFELAKVENHSIQFDVSPHGSDCQGEFHELQCERQCDGVSSPKFDTNSPPTLINDDPMSSGDHHDYALDAVLNSDNQDDVLPPTYNGTMFNCDLQDDALTPTFDNDVLDGNPQNVEPDEMHQTRFECSLVPSVKKDQPEVRLEDKLADETKNMETLPRTSKKHVALKDGLKNSQRQTLQVKTRTEIKTTKTTLKAQVPRKISNEAPRESRKIPRSEENLMRTKTENPSTAKTSKTAPSLARTSKPEDPKNLRAKLGQDGRSEKYLKVKKPGTTKSQHSTMEKSESRASQSMDRPKRTVNSMKSDVKPPSVILHFKRYEKAVKNKEVEPGHVKLTKSQSKSPSPGCMVEDKQPRSSKAGSQQGLSVSKSQNSAAQPQASKETDSSSAVASIASQSTPGPSTNKSHPPKFFKRSDLMGKNSIEKCKNCKQVSGGSKLKEDRIEGSRAVGAVGRSSSEVGRKAMKGVGCKNVGGDSGMDHLTVGIPS